MLEYHCPKCYHIPIYDVQVDFESIEIKCINNHIYKYKISDFLTKQPFNKIEIKCIQCLKEESYINNLFYCIQCKVYICYNHKTQNHKNCKDIISIEQINSTCLEHNQPYSRLCKTCNIEICNYCFLCKHTDHILSESFVDVLKKLKYLLKNEQIEKYLMKNLLSDYDYIEKVKITYKNLVELLDFLNKIYYKEISNQRFSYILYINIFILHNGLTKFKSYIKPTLDKGFKSEKNYVINDDNTYTLNKFLQCNIKFLQDIDLKDNLCEKNFLFQNNIFLFQSEKRIKLKTYNPYLKLLRNNKLEEIDLNKFDGNSVIYSIMPKQNKNIISDNKIEINEKTTILNPFVKTFDDNNNVKIENLYYSNLTYNDNNINQKIKENNFLFDGVKENEYNLFDFKNKCIILHNGYILIFLNTYNFHSYNRNLSEEEIIFYLILINNKNEVKNI